MTTVDYFFSGDKYIQVRRGDTGPGIPGPVRPITDWGWSNEFNNGIDAALYSGSKCYFFKGSQYIRMTRLAPDQIGKVDPSYPKSISEWNWPDTFPGVYGIDAALWSGPVCYFFKGTEYIRVHRGDTGSGTVDPGYPQPISNWPGVLGKKANLIGGVKGTLPSGSVCYFFLDGEYIRVNRGIEGAGYVDAGYPRLISEVWGWPDGFGANGIDAALYSGGPLVPPPSNGLVSNYNYYLQSGGLLLDLSATINFDEDFICSDANGASFQLNCYSEVVDGGSKYPLWQQFVIRMKDGWLYACINTWYDTAINDDYIYVNSGILFLGSDTIPAGYQFKISVNNDTENFSGNINNITGATFTVINNLDNTETVLGGFPINIVGQNWIPTNTPATYADLAPIVAFTFNIGGYGGGATANLTGASGSVTFAASDLLTAMSAEPDDIFFLNGKPETGESANLIFGPLPQTANKVISQLFEMTPAPAPGPGSAAFRKPPQLSIQGRRRHALPDLNPIISPDRVFREGGTS
jgi:hypothetical protein